VCLSGDCDGLCPFLHPFPPILVSLLRRAAGNGGHTGALLLSTEKGGADVRGTIEVLLNGKSVGKLALTPQNNDLLHQFVFRHIAEKSPNLVQVRFEGKGGVAYQVVGSYFLPWDEKPANEAMSIDVAYDRTKLAQDDIATATATIKNNLPKNANMVMVDLGIAPGFDLLSEDLQAYQEKQGAQERTAREIQPYRHASHPVFRFLRSRRYSQAALPPARKISHPRRTFQSRVYEYYDPQVGAVAPPVQLEVRKL